MVVRLVDVHHNNAITKLKKGEKNIFVMKQIIKELF